MRGPGHLARLALALCALAAWAPPATAERIVRMDVSIEVEADGSMLVTEEIRYDFEGEVRRGIYRDVPVSYSRRGSPDYRIELTVLDVVDELGAPHPRKVSSHGPYRRIRIGDPNRTVTGEKTYRIRYRVRMGVLFFDAHDEIYWNATGDEWPVAIGAAKVRISIAGTGRFVDAACFTGPRGATGSACSAEAVGNEARFEALHALPPRHGLSVVAALPKGLVREPTQSERVRARLDPWLSAWWLLPFATLVGMQRLWHAHGRDREPGAAVPVRYEPPEGLSPAEVGTLVDEQADLDDVTASILQLAVEGYLDITEIQSTSFLFFQKTDYRISKKRNAEGLKGHQRKLHWALFGGRDQVDVSELKNEFYEDLPGIKEALYKQLSGRGGYFAGPPDEVRTRWYIGGAFVVVAGVFTVGATKLVPGACIVLSGLAVLAFAGKMPRRTRKGRRAYEEILGFREFLERVDRDRLERQGTATREQFERILPYAIVLGCADQWADAFADIYLEPPSWYHGYDTHGFRSDRFVSDMGRSLDTIGHTLASQPSSGGGSSGFGGGGFSGGGFGGGGGGSW